MDGPKGYYSNWNKSDRKKKKKIPWFHLPVESKINKKNKTKQKEQTDTDTENKLVIARGERDGDWEK